MQDKDNRKNKRISIQALANTECNGHSCDALLMNFSNNGLGLLLGHKEFIDIGQKLNINFETGPKPTTVQGVIKWVRKLHKDKLFDFAVGMEIVDFDIIGNENLMHHAES